MATNKALFYPSIEITNEDWLKSNILFWDEIHTIVPESIDNPYTNRSTAILAERALLKPKMVNPDHPAVKSLSENMIEFLYTEEGMQLLWSSGSRSRSRQKKKAPVHTQKFGYEVQRILKRYPNKVTPELRNRLQDGLEEGWLFVDSSFANYYLTMLANKICEEEGLRLLTDNPVCSSLSGKVKMGIKGLSGKNEGYATAKIHQQLAYGIFTNLAIQRIDFHPSTSMEGILSFKEKNKDALGLFRANIKKLLKDVSTENSINGLREEVASIYHDEFLPSFHHLKKELSHSGLQWSCNNLVRVGFFSVSSTSIPMYLMGLTTPQALLAGAGISVVSSLISYNIEKKKTLRENPYNYLLEIERTL